MFVFNCCKPISGPVRTAPEENGTSEGKVTTMIPAIDTEMIRSKSEQRILQKTRLSTSSDGKGQGGVARSLFEASAYRVASHEYSDKIKRGQPDVDHKGIPDKFLELYLAALKDSNTRWASSPEVAALFADSAKLVSQDKQSSNGKAAVLRRLDQGVEMLVKMAGKDAAMPDWDVKGPNLTESLTHEYKCTVRRGALKLSFSLDFMIVGGKIQQLRNTRL